MKKIIIGNWKMNPATAQEATALFDAVKASTRPGLVDNVEVVVCPPFVYASSFKFQASSFKLGAQNVSLQEKGAFTSQISAGQLKDLGVEYVLIGHSEARKYLHETDQEINKKITAALKAGLKPILCVGENEGEDMDEVLRRQIPQGISDVIIAYEPVWAISSGDPYATKKLPTCEEIKHAKECIQKILAKDNAQNIKIIYGGSANAENAKQYLEIMDGLLVGGASLKADEFIKIVEAV